MKPKFFIITTISDSLLFFKGQLSVLKEIFNVSLVSNPGIHLNEMSSDYKVSSFPVTMKREISLWNDIKSLFILYKLFLKEKPVVVHGNTPKASLLSMVAAYFAHVPVRIYYVHGLRYTSMTGFKRNILMGMEKISCALATDIIAVSDGMRKQLVNDCITQKKIQLIWNGSINGIDISLFDRNKIENVKIDRIDSDDFVFGFVGRIVKDKGINELVQAFVKLKENYENVKLLILGPLESSDPVNNFSLEQIKNNNDIIYLGKRTNIKPYLKRMNLLIQPSYREGFGLVLIEAAAMKLASITTNIPGCNEVVINNETGFLIEDRNPDQLLEKMTFAINNKILIKDMGEIARKSVCERFNQAKVWEEAKITYSKIADKYV